mmetsp:Transcript_1641/g.3373  ORF Transcript_1641/g.3373 Transcript_1641/m.3373 type:complete len:204 (+) Transcript_1641:143-754(+)
MQHTPPHHCPQHTRFQRASQRAFRNESIPEIPERTPAKRNFTGYSRSTVASTASFLPLSLSPSLPLSSSRLLYFDPCSSPAASRAPSLPPTQGGAACLGWTAPQRWAQGITPLHRRCTDPSSKTQPPLDARCEHNVFALCKHVNTAQTRKNSPNASSQIRRPGQTYLALPTYVSIRHEFAAIRRPRAPSAPTRRTEASLPPFL